MITYKIYKMGICVSTVTYSDNAAAAQQKEPVHEAQPQSVQEIVRQQPQLKKDFDAEDSPLPAAACCLCCADPALCNLCCCDCGDCVMCYWCLTCDCCLEFDECCGQCLTNCI